MKKFLMAIIFSFMASISFANNEIKTVFISQVVDHPALNATTKGIIDALEKAGYKNKSNIDIKIESAQGNSVLAAQIASKFVSSNPDIVVGVGTMSAQSFAKYSSLGKTKLIFSSVTDPIGAGLAKSNQERLVNTTGVSNFTDLEPQLELFKQLQPKLKYLGVLYNPGEVNSVSIIKKLEEVSSKFGISIIKQIVTKTADVPQATVKLAGSVEAIFITNDNTALSSLQSIIKAADKVKIPVYVSDTDAVSQGALAAFGPSQYDIGLQTGKMIAKILQGTSINSLPIELPNKNDLYLNLNKAKKLGIVVSQDLQAQASKTIDGAK